MASSSLLLFEQTGGNSIITDLNAAHKNFTVGVGLANELESNMQTHCTWTYYGQIGIQNEPKLATVIVIREKSLNKHCWI